MAPSDHQLVQQLRAGDAGAFEALFERYGPVVHHRLVRVLRDETAADDLLQEIFLRLWTGAEQWRGDGQLNHYLLRMATNLALNHLRADRRRRVRPLQDHGVEEFDDDVPGWMIDSATLGPSRRAEQAEEREMLQSVLATLSEKKQQVLRLFYKAEMDINEIADEIGIPPGTVKSRLHHARADLAEAWNQPPDEV